MHCSLVQSTSFQPPFLKDRAVRVEILSEPGGVDSYIKVVFSAQGSVTVIRSEEEWGRTGREGKAGGLCQNALNDYRKFSNNKKLKIYYYLGNLSPVG